MRASFLLDGYPTIRRAGSDFRRAIHYNLDPRIPCTYLVNQHRYRAVANPYRSIQIDPLDVNLKIRRSHLKMGTYGAIREGDWDLEVFRFSESRKYQGLVEHFTLGVPWEETSVFRTVYAPRLEREGEVLGKTCLEDLARYYRRKIDAMFHDMKNNGFRRTWIQRWFSPLYVFVGRDGALIWGADGNHRIGIAKILKLASIPVRVGRRHADWQHIRERVAEGASGDVPRHLLEHADLQDVA